ncbi:hypothetical protein HPB51_015656 [Rhipicephalus microplus]|uniref:Uncharacterized protein n=1 Tax=Rhipicephalus microplus TaxID=6941 RepID=A0A9J6D5K0_RHIMP|nr:hypothetical protein HPB51_015656 [Rhipicephalus microplus]
MSHQVCSEDVSCNELSQLPPGIGELQALRSLRVRRNQLSELPAELCRLRLWRLDVSENQLARLPPLLRLMSSLRHLLVDGNPLVSPPAFVRLPMGFFADSLCD